MIYFPNILPELHPLRDDEVATRLQEYHSLSSADDPDRARGIRNMMVATGLRYDQWANNWSLLQQMIEEGRGPTAYNMLQFYIRGLAGNFVMNWFDPKFSYTELSEIDDNMILRILAKLQKVYYANKEHYDYKASAVSKIWNGLVYRGIEELVIDRTSDPRGVLRFESVRPDLVVFDNPGLTDRISRNSTKAFKRFHLLDEEAIRIFPHMEYEMRRAIEMKYSRGDVKARRFREPQQYEETNMNTFRSDTPMVNSRKLYIEEYEIEWHKERIAIHSESGIQFPDSGFEFGSEEDFLAKVMWGESNGLSVFPETIQVIDKYMPFLYTTTMCPFFGMLLEHRRDERQLGQHLPLYAWSFLEKNGKSIGAADLVIDCQDDINKRNNQATKLFTQSLVNGKTWIHPDAYGNSDERRQEMIENLNDSAAPLVLDEDAPAGQNLFGVLQGPGVNPTVLGDPAIKMDYMNRILSLPMAMQGFTERSGESGLHLGRKVIEGSIMQRLPLEGILQSENEKAEDWLIMALRKYVGPENYNREFTSKGGQNAVMVNRYMGRDELGQPIIEDDLSKLSIDRLDVIVSQSKENDFMKQAKRETDASVLQSIQPTATNGPAIAAFLSDLLKSSDFNDEEQKEKADASADLYWELEMSNGRANLLESKMRELTAQMNYDALMAKISGGQGPGAQGAERPTSAAPALEPPNAGEGAPPPEPAPAPAGPGERIEVPQVTGPMGRERATAVA